MPPGALRAPNLPVTSADQALILASIVEKETAREDERPKVAAVFINRLRLGMRLQTDPTVIYGLLVERYDGTIHTRDLETDTPYNTYTRAGLPPHPHRAARERPHCRRPCIRGTSSTRCISSPPAMGTAVITFRRPWRSMTSLCAPTCVSWACTTGCAGDDAGAGRLVISECVSNGCGSSDSEREIHRPLSKASRAPANRRWRGHCPGGDAARAWRGRQAHPRVSREAPRWRSGCRRLVALERLATERIGAECGDADDVCRRAPFIWRIWSKPALASKGELGDLRSIHRSATRAYQGAGRAE